MSILTVSIGNMSFVVPAGLSIEDAEYQTKALFNYLVEEYTQEDLATIYSRLAAQMWAIGYEKLA